MKVLSIGTDRQLFDETSEVRARHRAYAAALGSLDIIVFTTGDEKKVVDGTLTLIPTNSRSRWQYIRDARAIAKTRTKPDVVTAQDPFECGFAASRIARDFAVPLHAQLHTDISSERFATSFLNKIRLLIAPYVLKRAVRIRVVSQHLREYLIGRYRIPAHTITVLPIFADLQKLKAARVSPELENRFKSFSRVLLVVSRLEPEKNVELAIRSFLANATKDDCLVILGDGSERTRLLEEYRYAPNVLFEGQQDPAPYYKIADLVLATSRYEGYGRTIVEALAAETPVLSTDVGIAREAGAQVASETEFPEALKRWLEQGGGIGVLKQYPYLTFDEYVQAYRDDLAACAQGR